MSQEFKLFLVNGKKSSSWMNSIMNFGDTYGERISFVEHVVAVSSQEAIEQVWDRMEKKSKEYRTVAKKIRGEVVALEDEGRYREANDRTERAFNFIGGELSPISPSIPQDREKWSASVVEVEGYDIRVEPRAE